MAYHPGLRWCVTGCGVVSCNSSVTEVQEVCQWSERCGFQDEHFARSHPRECALAESVEVERVSSDICADVSTVLSVRTK